jgi:PIN domain nuclease of toxin-antitoxin system
MAKKINKYVIDACALIAFFQNETGGDKLSKLFKALDNEFFMHSINLTEVYYDAVYISGEEKAQELNTKRHTKFLLLIVLSWHLQTRKKQ